MKQFYFIFFILSFFYTCKSEDDSLIIIEEPVNLPPQDFMIRIENIKHDEAKISWDKAIDPENDLVKYDIFFEGKKIAENMDSLYLKIDNLNELQSYSGYIVAKDIHNNTNTQNFNFSTLKYYLKFIKYLDFGANRQNGLALSITKKEDNYIVSGTYRDDGINNTIFVFKLDKLGELIWQKYYTLPSDIYYNSSGNNVKIINYDSGYVLSYKFFVFKLDENGNKIWYKDLRDIYGSNQYISLESIIEDNQDNIIVVGNTTDFMGPATSDSKGIVTKLDKLGNLIWKNKYGLDFYNSIKDVAVSKENNLIFFGSTRGYNTSYNLETKFWLFKIDNKGNKIFERKFGSGHCFPTKIIKSSDNNYIILGNWWGAYDINTTFISKIASNGDIIWEKEESSFKSAMSIVELDNKDLIVSGYIGSSFSYIAYNKYNFNGELLWRKNHNIPYAYMYGRDVISDSDGGFRIISDFSKLNFYPWDEQKNPKLVMIKYDPDGNYN